MEMRKLKIRFIVALLTFLLGIGATAAWLMSQRSKQELRVMIPNAEWVPIFFEMQGLASKSINERTQEANLTSLRSVVLPDGDLEIRVWVGFGVEGSDGLILRRSSNQWSAIHLHGMAERPPFPQSKTTLATPKSGWEAAWGRLTDAGILTLPDSSGSDCESYGLDGTSYIVEINMNKTYRTYMYHEPHYVKCREAKQMVEIGEIVASEFGLQNFSLASPPVTKDSAIRIAAEELIKEKKPVDKYNLKAIEQSDSWRIECDLKDFEAMGGGVIYFIDRQSGKILRREISQ